MTNQKLINAFVFTAGAAIGSVVTWRILKSRYERYVQEEIDEFVKDWRERVQHPNVRDDEIDDRDCVEAEDEGLEDDPSDEEIRDYHQLARKYGEEGEKGVDFPYVNGPIVITPDEFGDGNFEHSLIALTYYSDGILANDWYETFDIDETIGDDALEHFGEYAEGVVHVRNEQNAADYEVVLDPRKFSDVTADDPLMAAYAT